MMLAGRIQTIIILNTIIAIITGQKI